ncbi:MAG: hypothetical protein NC041_07935 [Bacteroides sp.]|nr:hypothetical protein [Prevotella sp.]MCM1408387.1 hypothetical protein [Treponema brennaborense]MCM1470382.1 hypothetical protein [Bacteroides sp.]
MPKSYAKIGAEHNEILSDFYFGETKTKRTAFDSGINYKELSVEDYFGEISESYYFKSFLTGSARSISESDCFITQQMLEEGLVSEEAGKYISQVEKLLDNMPDSLEETKEAISSIELNSLEESSETILPEFISYAETAKSSLEFWSENIELLEGNYQNNSEARWILKKLWNKYKHKLKMMAASDAAGAAAGAALGAAIGAPIAGVGAGYGAAVGAALAGAASSAEGFKKDTICIIIPLERIKEKL